MSAFVISQLLIGIAFVVDLACWQFRKREITIILLMVSTVLISAHFFLLGALTAGIVGSLAATRYFVSLFTQRACVMWLFLFVMLCAGVYTFDGLEDLFAIGASMFGTIAAFQMDGRKMRLVGMIGTSSVVIHNMVIWTPAGILLEVFFLGSNMVSYFRFYIHKQRRVVRN